MKKKIIKRGAQIVLYGTLIALLTAGIALSQYKVGDSVANFTLADVNGNPVSLSDYQGKVLLLNFFTSFG